MHINDQIILYFGNIQQELFITLIVISFNCGLTDVTSKWILTLQTDYCVYGIILTILISNNSIISRLSRPEFVL